MKKSWIGLRQDRIYPGGKSKQRHGGKEGGVWEQPVVALAASCQSITSKPWGTWQYVGYQKWVNFYIEQASNKPESSSNQL